MTASSLPLQPDKKEVIKERPFIVFWKRAKYVLLFLFVFYIVVHIWISVSADFAVSQIIKSGGEVWYSSETVITESIVFLDHRLIVGTAGPDVPWEEAPNRFQKIIFPPAARRVASNWFGQTRNFVGTVNAVRLDDCCLSFELFDDMQCLTGIRWLSLSSSIFDPTDANLFFENAVALEWIIADHTQFNDTHIRLLSNCQHLRWLDIQGTQVTDSGLSELNHFKNLRFLDASNTPITDVGVRRIAENTNLVELHLNATAISDKGIKHLARLSLLERLSLRNTHISNREIKSLLRLPKLKFLDLSGTEITEEQMIVNRKEAPNVEILGGSWY